MNSITTLSTSQSLTTLAIGIFLIVLGFVASYFILKSSHIKKSEHAQLQTENALLEQKIISLTETLEDTQNIQAEYNNLYAENQVLLEKIKMKSDEFEALQKQSAQNFENLANRIFDEKTKKFEDLSSKNLSTILNPLRERMAEFQKKVDDSFGKHALEQNTLKNEIARIVEANTNLTLQADSLTKALKGDSKAQGNWGEVMLERILEQSGLRKDTDYILQGAGMGLKGEGGRTLLPDVVVNLQEGKTLIVDSKVSLTSYERFIASTDDTEKQKHVKDFILSIRTHIKNLQSKEYQHNEKLLTPDFVLMFMPIEGAYSLAVQSDETLHADAWQRGIILVSPTTLYATLRTVAYTWKLDAQNKNAEDIAKRGGALYDKFVAFVEDMQKINNHIESLNKTYDAAMNKLSTGTGNLTRQAEMLNSLGIKSSKSLPKNLIES